MASVLCRFSSRTLLRLTRGINMKSVAVSQIHNKAFINGNWVEAKTGQNFPVLNPSTDEVIVTVPDMDEHDTEVAIQAAFDAFPAWKDTTAKEKAQKLRKWYNLMMDNQQHLAEVLTKENGKPLSEAMGEISYAADYLEFYSEESRRIHGEVLQSPIKSKKMILVREPIGVVGMLTPWNFPTAMIARKVAAALAAGCTVVMKPAEDTPLSTLEFAALGEKAGIPNGVINVVTSSRKNAPAVGNKLCSSPQVSGISFTGSTTVGKLLYKQCAVGVKRLSLELGGNAPFIVFPSADLDKAVAGCMIAKFRNAGQTCVSVNRIFVHESIEEEFIAKLKSAMSELVVGNGFDSKTSIGPLINLAQFLKVSTLVEDAISKGATVHLGGSPHSFGKLHYQPTLLSNIKPTMQVYAEEVFGPVATVTTFKTEKEVIEKANDTTSGLAGYFYSNDIAQTWRVSAQLQYGMVGINESIISSADAAFGGIKESGFGREGSKHGIEDYTNVKYLCFGNLA